MKITKNDTLRFIIMSRLLFHVIYDYLSARYVNGIKSVPRHSLITRTYILCSIRVAVSAKVCFSCEMILNMKLRSKEASAIDLQEIYEIYEISQWKEILLCMSMSSLTKSRPDNVTKHPITNWLISWRVIDSCHIIIAFIMTLFLMRFYHLLRHGVK